MAYTTYDRYLEAEILSADPIKLVSLLYRGAAEAVGAARRHLEAGDIGARSHQIMKAWDILQELTQSLDHEQAPEISRNLAALYAYCQERLVEANGAQTDGPLAEVENLLQTVAEAWRDVEPPAPEAGSPEEEYRPVSATF